MAAIFRAECTRNSKKETKFFDSKQEAIDYLMDVASEEAIASIPHNGNLRKQAFREAVPKYLDKVETIEDNISEWIPPQKKK